MTKSEIIKLLEIKNLSKEFFELLYSCNKKMRENFGNKGYIFAQIGINCSPCSGNCKFCSLAKNFYSINDICEKNIEDIMLEIKQLHGINDLFLMTTADYPHDKFLEIVKTARALLDSKINLVINTSDMDYLTALEYKKAGVYAAYHIVRLREGIDTDISPVVRRKTIDNIIAAGIQLYYCIEPIGKEHSYSELADAIEYAASLKIDVMAVMKRINTPGSPLNKFGEIDSFELIKIACVTALAVNPHTSMNVHEVNELSLITGINQLYAEYGVNPRDITTETNSKRGLSVDKITEMLINAGLQIQQ